MLFVILFSLFTCLLKNVEGGLQANISAPSAVLINADTGAVLYEKEAHTVSYPASITKIATALYALQQKGDSLEEMVTASSEAISAVSPQVRRLSSKHPPYRLEFGGTHMGIKAGEELSFRALLYGLMLPSGNDAANVIAEYVSGSIPSFMEELNAYMQSLGCQKTRFCSPHGLPHPEHQTTAYEIALIAKEAMKSPFFREVVKTTIYPRPKTNKQEASQLVQFNRLLKRGAFFYPKAIGIKTGYTVSAGANLVAAAEHEGRCLIAVLMGSSDPSERFKDAITLFEKAFAEQKIQRTLFTKEFDHFTLTLKHASKPMHAHLKHNVVWEYYPSEELPLKAFLKWEHLTLPIIQGTRVGSIEVMSEGGALLCSGPLFATETVEKTFWRRLLDKAPSLPRPWALLLCALGVFSLFLWVRILRFSRSG